MILILNLVLNNLLWNKGRTVYWELLDSDDQY